MAAITNSKVATMRLIGIGTSMILFASLGCAESKWPGEVDVSPARGTVTVAGQGLPGAHLVFHPTNPTQKAIPQAYTGPDGGFAATSFRTGDGVVPGEYVVTLRPNPHPESYDPRYVAAGVDLLEATNAATGKIPKKYSDAKTSPLKVVIEANKPDLGQLDLK